MNCSIQMVEENLLYINEEQGVYSKLQQDEAAPFQTSLKIKGELVQDKIWFVKYIYWGYNNLEEGFSMCSPQEKEAITLIRSRARPWYSLKELKEWKRISQAKEKW